jgi:hypothetical protein
VRHVLHLPLAGAPPGGKLVCLSSAYAKQGFFYEQGFFYKAPAE